MRIAQRVQQVLSSNPQEITLENQKVGFKFQTTTKQTSLEKKKLQAELSKATWTGWIKGMFPKRGKK